MVSEVGFVAVDYIVFALVFLTSVAIGTYHAITGGRNKTSEEFHLGNRKMKILPLMISMMVSNQSSIMMLGYPAETYLYGGMIWLSVVGYVIAFFIAVRIVVPLFHPLKLTSVNEYFQLRYDACAVRRFASVCGALVDTFYSGLVMYGPAIALEGVTGVPMWISILCIAVSSIIYTSLGGIKAVVWTDVFQFLVLYVGIFAVLIQGTILAGGLSNVWDINRKTGRINFVSFDPDPTRQYTFWSLVVGSTIKSMVIPFRQTSVQRISCMSTAKEAKTMLYLIGPAFAISTTLAMSTGLVAYAYYYHMRCDPIASRQLSSFNQLIPYMVLDIFRNTPGMSGLFISSLFCASLSTVSSNLSGLSAITLEDYIKPRFKNMSEFRATLVSKCTVVIYGILATLLAFMVAEMKGSLYKVALSILSVFSAPLFGMFIYSAFWPRATHLGCFVGGFTGLVVTLWICMGQSFSAMKLEPFLSFAPTDRCFPRNGAPGSENMTEAIVNSTPVVLYSLSTTIDSNITTESPRLMTEDSGFLDKLYSISFYWFDTLAVIVILIVALITSLVIGRPEPHKVEMKYMLSFSEQFTPCLPHKVKVFLSCCVDVESRRKRLHIHENGKAENEQALELIPESPTSVNSIPITSPT